MKECKYCYTHIDQRALICPNCKQSTSFWGRSNWSDIFGFVLMTGLICLILYIELGDKDAKKQAARYSELSPKVVSVDTYTAFDALYVRCLGDIKNPSELAFRNIHFEITLLDQAGVLVDAFNTEDDNIIVEPNKTSAFRVTAVASKPSVNYDKCTVRITGASIRK